MAPGRKYDFYRATYRQYPDLTLAKAKEIGDRLGIDWSLYDLGEFRQGIKEEMEHGSLYSGETHGETQVHADSYEVAGRIALAHLVEAADYYQRLEELEETSEEFWGEGENEEHKRKEWIKQNYHDEARVLHDAGVEIEASI